MDINNNIFCDDYVSNTIKSKKMEKNKQAVPPPGKIFILFTADQLRNQGMKGRFLIVNPENPNDQSIERCSIYNVSEEQKFFTAGDSVIIDYTVFTVGKDKRANMSGNVSTRELFRIDKGDGTHDSIYWAYDGSDGFNESEIFGKIVGEKILMQPPGKDVEGNNYPGWLLVEPPKIVQRSLIIHYEEKEKTDKPLFTKVIATHDHKKYSVGDEILIAPFSARPIYFDDKEFGVLKDIYVWGRKIAKDAEVK